MNYLVNCKSELLLLILVWIGEVDLTFWDDDPLGDPNTVRRDLS